MNSQRREYEFNVPPVLEIARAEERGPELTIRKQSLRDRLRDGALPRSGQPIQPVDRGPVEVVCPKFNTIQNGFACASETPFAPAVSVLGPMCATEIIEE